MGAKKRFILRDYIIGGLCLILISYLAFFHQTANAVLLRNTPDSSAYPSSAYPDHVGNLRSNIPSNPFPSLQAMRNPDGKLNHETFTTSYVDCAGRPFAELKETFDRDGILLFTPCSLSYDHSVIDRVNSKMNKWCGPTFEGNTCDNRVVKSEDEDIMRLARDPEITMVLDGLHGRTSFPFQTLNFKWGTRQPAHSDLIHFAGFPSMTLSAAWIAFEDILSDAGPLEYYLGSHKANFQTMQMLGCDLSGQDSYQGCYQPKLQEIIDANESWRPTSVLPKKGDVILWASNAIHGGSAVKDHSLSRQSQVTHYFFEGDDLYIQPKFSNLVGDYVRNPSKSKFSLRTDVPIKAKAVEFTNKHWQPASKIYKGHYPVFHKENFHDHLGNKLPDSPGTVGI